MESAKEKKNISMYKVMARQLKLIKKRKKSYLYLIFFLNMIAGGVLPVLLPFIPKLVIDYLVEETNVDRIIYGIAIISGISLILACITVVCDSIKFVQFIDLRMQEFYELNERYLKIDYANLEDPVFRDRYQTATNALDSNHSGFEGAYHNFYALLPLFFSTILLSIIIGSFQHWIFVACLIGGIVTIIVNRAIANYVEKRKADVSRTSRKRNYFYETCYDFTYGKDIRVYSLENKLANDYKKHSYNYLTVMKQIANRRFLVGLFELIMLLLQDGLAYFFVIKAYFEQSLTLGEVSFYIAAIIALSTTLRSISATVTLMNTNTRFTVDYFAYLDDKSHITLQGDKEALAPKETLEIEFKDVSFKYPRTERYILKNFNFKINKGEKLAIVGINGAGKSTIVKLITGLFLPTSGEILVNGINILKFNEEEYQKMFSVVFQDVNIYATSVLKNVIGTDQGPEARKRGIACLNLVGLQEKIESLPKQYDTEMLKVIDETGIEMSGGQNQKLAIARALYKDANMIILDEPTASLDALAEGEIYQNFDKLVEKKTAIYISHRLSSTKFCDKIALFTNDGLKEYGSHAELIELKGEYYQMFMTQGKYYQEEA
ncbi:MAG: ABC transporter ATP-binding protein [Bacilli bacterium]|nr:ABC transporter ATP-binding protein [Bacilli bacterium]